MSERREKRKRWVQRGRYAVEPGDQQLKEELGRDHHEGRSWRGFHHHAGLVMPAYGFLTREQRRAKPKPTPAPRGRPGIDRRSSPYHRSAGRSRDSWRRCAGTIATSAVGG